jgi:hypothetical protein
LDPSILFLDTIFAKYITRKREKYCNCTSFLRFNFQTEISVRKCNLSVHGYTNTTPDFRPIVALENCHTGKLSHRKFVAPENCQRKKCSKLTKRFNYFLLKKYCYWENMYRVSPILLHAQYCTKYIILYTICWSHASAPGMNQKKYARARLYSFWNEGSNI